VVVGVARKHTCIAEFFSKISTLLNVVGGSSKRRDMIRDINLKEVSKALGCGLLETRTGLNQEQCLQRPGDTRWSSHYKSLRSLVNLFQTIIKVLEFVENEDNDGKAMGVLVYFQSFEFVFYLHLMLNILTITNVLSNALQRKDQDIVNAVNCVRSTRSHLDKVRRDGWEQTLGEVYAFCDEHDISMLEMNEPYIDPTRPRKKIWNYQQASFSS